MEQQMMKMQNEVNISYLKFLKTLVTTIDEEISQLTEIMSGGKRKAADGETATINNDNP